MRAALSCISRALRSSAVVVEQPRLVLDYMRYHHTVAKAIFMGIDEKFIHVNAANIPSFAKTGTKKITYQQWSDDTRNTTFERIRLMLACAVAITGGVLSINKDSNSHWAEAPEVFLHASVCTVAGAVIGYYSHYALPVVFFYTGVTTSWRALRALRRYKK